GPGCRAPRDEDYLEAQRVVMMEAAAQAAIADRDPRFLRFTEDFESMVTVEAANDERISAATELRFKLSMLRLWKSPALGGILLGSAGRLFGPLSVSPRLLWVDADFRRNIMEKNRLIFIAISRRDVEGARSAMRAYFDYVIDRYQQVKRDVGKSN